MNGPIRAVVLVVLALAIGVAWQLVADSTRVPLLDFRLDAGRAAP